MSTRNERVRKEQIKELNNFVKSYFVEIIQERFDVGNAETFDELLNDYGDSYEYISEFLHNVTNNCEHYLYVCKYLDLDFITPSLMSYMIEYIHKKNDNTMLDDYSIENIMSQYTYWYSREDMDFNFFETLFGNRFNTEDED